MADDELKLFGIDVFAKERAKAQKKIPQTFSPPMDNDGAAVVENVGQNNGMYAYGIGGFMSSAINIAGPVKDEIAAIKKYRQMAQHHNCNSAVEDIANEAIVHMDDEDEIVWLNLDKIDAPVKVKSAIEKEFSNVLDLMDFNNNAYDLFRSWYVDGRLYYHKIVDKENPTQGIQALRRIDPVLIKKIREITRTKHPANPQLNIITKIDEYFVYNEQGNVGEVSQAGVKLSMDAITFVHSGMVDPMNKTIVGYLDKAYRPLNQVRMIEDALVIYRMARAPERRVFNVDVGNLPPMRAEQHVQQLMNQYRNRLVYDSATGQIQDNSHHMHMLEDFWMPKGQGGSGTTVEVLQGGQNLSQIDDIGYFKKELYMALDVPVSRMDPEGQGMALARASEISRDEIKFSKMIKRLQRQFGKLFLDILKTNLLLKKIITVEEWNQFVKQMFVQYAQDNHYAEAIELDLLDGRINALMEMREYIGVFFSQKYVRNHILKQTDEQIEQMNAEIMAEKRAEAIYMYENQELLPPPVEGQDGPAISFMGDVDYSSKAKEIPAEVLAFMKERNTPPDTDENGDPLGDGNMPFPNEEEEDQEPSGDGNLQFENDDEEDDEDQEPNGDGNVVGEKRKDK